MPVKQQAVKKTVKKKRPATAVKRILGV